MSADPTAEHIDAACEVMHDAYERAAVGAGWETNPASRKPWADVPEANKATMRAAVGALLAWPALAASLPAEVMLAALVDRGALTEEWRVWFTGSDAPTAPVDEATSRRFTGDHRERRRVTPWEVAE